MASPLPNKPRAVAHALLYQTVVKVLPTTWAMIGFNNVIVCGQGPPAVLLQVGALLLFAGLFFVVGIWRLRFD